MPSQIVGPLLGPTVNGTLGGATTMHGPVSVAAQAPAAVGLSRWDAKSGNDLNFMNADDKDPIGKQVGRTLCILGTVAGWLNLQARTQ